jgi:hypothetical protein
MVDDSLTMSIIPFIYSARKRVTVVFRGSVTSQDFLTDATIKMTCEKNPFADIAEQDKLLKYHSGFYCKLVDCHCLL